MDIEMCELVAGAHRLGIELSLKQQKQFEAYSDLLLTRNKNLNLVRVHSRMELLCYHMLDSLWCSVATNLYAYKSILDIGSGAGFPGIPLKICFPDSALYLMESQRKRSLFLEDAIKYLGLENCTVLTGRAEDLARNAIYREQFDCVVARAVAPLVTLAELTIPFVRMSGHFIALKGYAAKDEVSIADYALSKLGGAVEKIIPYCFPEERGRHIISIVKIAATPDCYPRRCGTPAKKPLLAGVARMKI